MAAEGTNAIQEAAEEAVRQASGDWREAGRLLRDSIENNRELKEHLLAISLRRELREAAFRLGAGTVICVSCGEEVPVDAETCRFCGETPGHGASSSAPQAPAKVAAGGPTIRHFTLLTGWILIVLIVILIISFTNGSP